jgi:hypothetical protein
MDHFSEDETTVETTTRTTTVSRGNKLANFQRVLSSARQTASDLGMEILVTLVDDLQAALSADDAAQADATARVNATVSDASAQIATLTAELQAALGQVVTQAMVDHAAAIGTAIGTIDAPAAVTPPPPAFVQGTNADGTPMVDPVTGAPVDQNGNPDPNVAPAATIQGGTPA